MKEFISEFISAVFLGILLFVVLFFVFGMVLGTLSFVGFIIAYFTFPIAFLGTGMWISGVTGLVSTISSVFLLEFFSRPCNKSFKRKVNQSPKRN